MTYNFDPDRWYEMQRSGIDWEHSSGRLDDAAFEEALARLDADYDRMLERLDGTFRIGNEGDAGGPGEKPDPQAS